MKKILILAAMQMHIPLIRKAKERGLYVLTCDYIPENEGHAYADEKYFESTTDMPAVLSLAKNKKVDAILTFNSDPAAPTAAYVAEKLGLPNSGYEAVKIMSEKDLFREFLFNHNFNVPKFDVFTHWDDLESNIPQFSFPILIKPVDSSGSKGVAVIEDSSTLKEYFEYAMNISRCKRVIVEEFIEPLGPQLHGDGFVADGELKFIYLGDHHFNASINNLVPYSTTFPSEHSEPDIQDITNEVQRFISLVGFKQGGINIEARISKKDRKIYLIEVGARNGGNFTPIIIQYASGFNFIDAALDAALGMPYKEQGPEMNGYFAYLILHSVSDGILTDYFIHPILEDKIIEKYIYVQPGKKVFSFKGANAAVGVLLLKFSSNEMMQDIVANFSDYYKVILE